MATSFNTKFAETLLKHDVDLMRVEAGARQEILGVLKGLEKQTITNIQKFGTPPNVSVNAVNKQLGVLVTATGDTSQKAYSQMTDIMEDTMIKNGAVQTDIIVTELNKAITVDLGLKKLNLEVLKRLPGTSLIEGAPMEQWFKKQNVDWQNRFMNEMREGMINGESVEDMTRRVRGTQAAGFKDGIMQTSRREAQTLVRSSVLAGANKARESTYLANSDVIKGQQWLATLDSRTSDICISLDGAAWFLSGKPMPGTSHSYLGPPPAHFNCRSTLVPVTKSFSELAKNTKMRVKLEKMPKGKRNGLRASMDGAVSNKLNYEEWLASRPPAFQLDVLGPTKFRMWQGGQLPLRELIDQSHNPINIDTLIAQHGIPQITLDTALEKAAHSQVVAGTKFESPQQWFNKFGKTSITPEEVIANEDKLTVAKLAETKKRLNNGKTTASKFENADGTWDAQRVADVHDPIIDEILNAAAIKRATPPPGITPRYAVFGGRGGSGKGALTASKKDGGLGLFGDDFINLNVDDIKEMIKASNGAKGYEGWNAFHLHKESSEIFARIDDMARKRGLNVIHDITLRGSNTPMARLLAYESAGYQVEGYYMFLPPEEAAKRAIGRFRGFKRKFDGRYVPPNVVLGNTANEANFAAMQKHFKRWEFYDNQGNKPRLVGKGGVPAEEQIKKLESDITKFKQSVESGQKPPAQVQASFDSLSAAEQKLIKEDIEKSLTVKFEVKEAALKKATQEAAQAAAEAATAAAEVAAAEAATAAVQAAEAATAKAATEASQKVLDTIKAQKATFEKRALIKLQKADPDFGSLTPQSQLEKIIAQVEIDKAKKQISDGIVNFKKAVVAGKTPPPAAVKAIGTLTADEYDKVLKAIGKTKAAQNAAIPAKPINQVIEEFKAGKLTDKEFIIEYHKAKSTLKEETFAILELLDAPTIKSSAKTLLDGFEKHAAQNVARAGTPTAQATQAKAVKKMAQGVIDELVDAVDSIDYQLNYTELKWALAKLEKEIPGLNVSDLMDIKAFKTFGPASQKAMNDQFANALQSLIASDATAIEFATTGHFTKIPAVQIVAKVKPPSVTTVRIAANDVVKGFITGESNNVYEFNYMVFRNAFGKVADDVMTYEQWVALSDIAKKNVNTDMLGKMAALLEETGTTAKQLAASGKMENVPMLISTGGKAALPKVGKKFKSVVEIQNEAKKILYEIDQGGVSLGQGFDDMAALLGKTDVKAANIPNDMFEGALAKLTNEVADVSVIRASAVNALKKAGFTKADEVAAAVPEVTAEIKTIQKKAAKMKQQYDDDLLHFDDFKEQASVLLGKEGLDLPDTYVAIDWVAGDVASAQEAITAAKKVLAAKAKKLPDAGVLSPEVKVFQNNATFTKNLFDDGNSKAENFKKSAAKLLGIEDASSMSVSQVYTQLDDAIKELSLAKVAVKAARQIKDKAAAIPKGKSIAQIQDEAQQFIEDFRFGKFDEKEALKKAAEITGVQDSLPALLKLEGSALDVNLDKLISDVRKISKDKDIAAFHIKQGGLTVIDDIPKPQIIVNASEINQPSAQQVKEATALLKAIDDGEVAGLQLFQEATQIIDGEFGAVGDYFAMSTNEQIAIAKKLKGNIKGIAEGKLVAKEIIEEAPKPKIQVVKEVVEEAPPPSTVTNATPPPDMDNVTRIGEQAGSNPGGLFQDTTTGQKWYIKTPASEDMARNEVLAGKLYELLGIEAPELYIVKFNGKTSVASKIIDGLDSNATLLRSGSVSGVGEGFAADAWLANWDVVGLGYDNLLVKSGRAIRVDTGGALRYRAQGGLKGKAFGNTVDELDSLRNPSNNQQAASVFGNLTDDEIKAGARKIANVSDGDIRDLVRQYGPVSASEQKELIDILIARKKDIKKRFKLRASPKRTKKTQPAKPPEDINAPITQTEAQQIEDSRSNGFALVRDKDAIEDQSILAWTENTDDGKRAMLALKVRGEAAETLAKSVRASVGEAGETTTVYMAELDGLIEQSVKGLKFRLKEPGKAVYDSTISARVMQTLKMHADTRLKLTDALKRGEIKQKVLDDFDFNFKPWVDALDATRKKFALDGAIDALPDNFPRKLFKRDGMPEVDLVPLVQESTSKIKWVRREFNFEEKKLTKGVSKATGKTVNPVSSGGGWFETKIDDVTVRYFSKDTVSGNFALQERIDIITKPGMTHEQGLSALRKLGINVERATEFDAEELYLRQIMSHMTSSSSASHGKRFNKFLSELAVIADDSARLDKARALVSEALGSDVTKLPEYNYKGAYQAFGHGNRNLMRPDLNGLEWDNFADEVLLHHRNTSRSTMPEVIDMVLNSGGNFIATTDKIRRGVALDGMSPDSDLRTGGASYFFTRIRPRARARNEPGVVWKAKHLKRLDSVSFDHDAYGEVAGGYVGRHRKTGTVEWLKNSRTTRNETIFKNGLSLFDDLDSIVVETVRERDDILRVFAKHGLEIWPDGRKLNEIVIVRG